MKERCILKQILIITVCVSFLSMPAYADTSYYSVDFSSVHNVNFSNTSIMPNGNTFPTGQQTLGGIPFDIPESGDNYWNSHFSEDGILDTGSNPKSIDIQVNRFGVSEVHTLINTLGGQAGNSYACLEFFGSDGAYYKKDLYGNSDIRDFNQGRWTNIINNTTTIKVFDNSQGQRLDKQMIELPIAFLDEELSMIRLTDNGRDNFQRVFLAGITVGVDSTVYTTDKGTVENSTFFLVSMGKF